MKWCLFAISRYEWTKLEQLPQFRCSDPHFFCRLEKNNTIHISVFKSKGHKRSQFARTPRIRCWSIFLWHKEKEEEHNTHTNSKPDERKHTAKSPWAISKSKLFYFLDESGLSIFSPFFLFLFDIKKIHMRQFKRMILFCFFGVEVMKRIETIIRILLSRQIFNKKGKQTLNTAGK